MVFFMILSEYVLIKPTSNIKNLREKGYYLKSGDIIKVLVKDLSLNSKTKIRCRCDVVGCGNEKELSYQNYMKN